MNTKPPNDPAEDFPGILLATVTLEAVEDHYRELLGGAYVAFPAISCDLDRLAELTPCFDLLSLFRPDAHAMIWLMQIDEDHFFIVTALHSRVAAALHLIAAMADQVACVRPFRAEFVRFAATLERLLSHVSTHED
jgi:hypothetical protein